MADSKKTIIPVAISIVALLVSVITAGYTMMRQQKEDIRSKKEELRKIISELVNLREDHSLRIISLQDIFARETASKLCETKVNIYLTAAEYLIHQISEHVSSIEYRTIAYEYEVRGNYELAEKYYKKALNKSTIPLEKALSLREVASLQFSKLGKAKEGRNYYEQAINLLDKIPDPYFQLTKAETYRLWATQELFYGDRNDGFLKIEQAKMVLSTLPEHYRYIADCELRHIEETLKQIGPK